MRRILCALTAGAMGAWLLAGARPAAQQRPEVALRAAIETETVRGDLQAAIRQYAALASSPDRAVAAQALVRMAGCHRKLGDTEARAIYERVVREFADQPEAVAAARAGLAAGGGAVTAAGAKGDRAVWTGDKVDMFGRVSPDGRYITYVDWGGGGNLAMRDVVTGTDRLLTSYQGAPYSEFAEYSTVSADGTEVAYVWGRNPDQLREIRRLALNGAGPKPPVRIYAAGKDVRFFGPLDWSADKSRIATVVSSRTEGTGQIALIGVADGSVTALRAVKWKEPERLFLSPDGRYLAYDLQAGEVGAQRDVYVMEIASRREVPAVQHSAEDAVLGWSPDGRQLLFSSDRTGASGIWAQPMEDGHPAGAPELLKAEGAGFSLGLSRTGTLFVFKTISSRDVQIADFDLAAGALANARGFTRGFVPRTRSPDWSRDGRSLAYAGCAESNCVVVRSVATGEARTLAGGLLFVREPRWSPDGRTLLAAARNLQGRDGIFTVDAQSGAVTPVVIGPRFAAVPVWSADGSKIYYLHDGLVERTLATGAERTLLPGVSRGLLEVSPDGRLLALIVDAGDSLAGPGRVVVVPAAGGEPRDILTVAAPESLGPARTMAWTPDGRAVIVMKSTPTGRALWEVPVDGRSPRRLAIDATRFTDGGRGLLDQGFSLSPDGRQVAFLSGRSAYEVWAVENLLPAARR